MPTLPDERPRVMASLISRGQGNTLAVQSHYALATRGAVELIPTLALNGSLLALGHNKAWAEALKWAKAGIVDYLLLHHDDIEVQTHGWLDVMVAEMRRTGAAVLSAVVAIKNETGDTSTALEVGDPWMPRRLKLAECAALGETFTRPDLLVNTGLMLINLRRAEFFQVKDSRLVFYFTICDRVVERPDGEYVPQVRPEDWNFSRLCHQYNLPVYATNKVVCIHHGDKGFSNQVLVPHPTHYYHEIPGWFDFEEVYREAVNRTPDGGTIVEVGCWRGKSLSFLLVEARDSEKQLRVYGVDHFRGSSNEPTMQEQAREEDLANVCRNNANRAGYPWNMVKLPSVEAAARFDNESVDFCFIDGDHSYQAVADDILAWLPKVKPGGVLAGHDFDEPGAARAVRELLPKARPVGRCWWYEKPAVQSVTVKDKNHPCPKCGTLQWTPGECISCYATAELVRRQGEKEADHA